MRFPFLRHLAAAVLVAVLPGWPRFAAAALEPGTPFELKVSFAPSLMPKSQFTFASTGQGGRTSLEIQVEAPQVKELALPVAESVAAEFLREVSQIRLKPSKREAGLDGCDVTLALRLAGNEAFSSHVWSPTRRTAPAEDALLRSLYKIVEHSAASVPPLHTLYLEQLFGDYLDRIQPAWRVFGGKGAPTSVRFYASLTSDDIPAFRELIASLPKEGGVITFDITHLGGTGTLFHAELMQASVERRIQWRAGKTWARWLGEIGISKKSITVVEDEWSN